MILASYPSALENIGHDCILSDLLNSERKIVKACNVSDNLQLTDDVLGHGRYSCSLTARE